MTSRQGREISSAKYTLQVGQRGRERLEIINELYNPSTMAALEAKVAQGARDVLEVACGNGQVAIWLAQRLAALGGRVLATDISPAQLEIARAMAREAAVTNIEFRELSGYELAKLEPRFDLAYSRFVLVHISEPARVIAGMKGTLAPGGVVLCEEATASSCYCAPEAACLDRWLELWRHLRKANNAELDLGGLLPSMFEKTGLHRVQEHTAQPALDTPSKRKILRLNVLETKSAAIETGFASEAELDQLIRDLAAWEVSDTRAAYMRIHQVSGTRP